MERMMCRGARVLSLTLCCLMWVTGVAGAQDPGEQTPSRPKVLMLPIDSVEGKVTSLVTTKIDEETRKNLRRSPSAELLPTFEEIRKTLKSQGQSSAAIAQAEKAYASGLALLTAGENKQAVESFQRAIGLMEGNIADVSNYASLFDTLKNLSLAYHNSGYDLDSKKRMKEFAHLRPAEKVNAEKFPKALVEVLEKEQQKVAKAGPGVLKVTSDPPGAMVFIDGVVKGVTPAEVKDVGFGFHHLVVRGAKGAVWSEKIRVRGKGKKQEFKAEFGVGTGPAKPTVGADGMPSFYGDIRAAVRTGKFEVRDIAPKLNELANQSGAESIAWVLVYKKGLKYRAAPFVYRPQDGRMVVLEEAEFNLELSDIPIRVIRLAKDIGEGAKMMPVERASSDVWLLKPEPVVKDPVIKDPVVKDPVVKDPVVKDPVVKDPVVKDPVIKDPVVKDPVVKDPLVIKDPGQVPPTERPNMWTYIGAGTGAALLLGGIVAGTIFLFSMEPAAVVGDGFDAEVSW